MKASIIQKRRLKLMAQQSAFLQKHISNQIDDANFPFLRSEIYGLEYINQLANCALRMREVGLVPDAILDEAVIRSVSES